MDTVNSKLLFLCTGNYYRSRFAEHLFNHYAPDHNLPWRAFSRGLATYKVPMKAGPISPYALEGLVARGVTGIQVRSPIQLIEQDLSAAHHIVALKHAEHHSLISHKYPDWIDRIEFWHVHDIDEAAPQEALPQIDAAIQELLARLALTG
jgi:protein-tyrosine phosphatase